MGDFIKAIHNEEPCLLNMDYVMDVYYGRIGQYKAYTMDFDRGYYLIDRAEFDKWRAERENKE